MSDKQYDKSTITQDSCQTIKKIFQKYKNIDELKLKKIISLIQKRVDEKKILKQAKISKNKLYRYVCHWIVENNTNIHIKPSPRGYGKNNYNKFAAKAQKIICGLENCFTITELCFYVGLSHQTMIKYLYKLMNTEQAIIFD